MSSARLAAIDAFLGFLVSQPRDPAAQWVTQGGHERRDTEAESERGGRDQHNEGQRRRGVAAKIGTQGFQ